MSEEFGGNKKYGKWLLASLEKKFRDWLIQFIPSWIHTVHLTLATLLFSSLVIVFSFLAQYEINYLWGSSLMIILQYLTDLLDGELGRRRNSGLIKWGYYMDHFLDYMFLTSIIIGYSILFPPEFAYLLFFAQAILVGFMVSAYLQFAATNEFRISHLGIGPTEIRFLFIIINTLIIFFGKTYLGPSLPYILIFITIGLFIVVYQVQKTLWKIDMENKK